MGDKGKFDSWEIVSDTVAIKSCDKSFFKHKGSGIPKKTRWFFNAENMLNGEQIKLILIYKGKEYDAYIDMETSKLSRTRIFWRTDLKKEFDEILIKYRGQSEKKDEYPSIQFTKLSENCYNVEFIDLEELNDYEINPLETVETEHGVEGKKIRIYTTKYERDQANRKEAIRIHGTRCMVCDFDFEEVYGELGKDFIEVHHTKPLSSLEHEVEVNPEEDLVCLCSNCHRMIHRNRNKIMTVEELKKLMEERSVFA